MLTKILCIALIYIAFVQTNAEYPKYDGELPAAYYEEIHHQVDLPVKVKYHVHYDLAGNPVVGREKHTHRRHRKRKQDGSGIGGFFNNLLNVGRSGLRHGVDMVDENADAVVRSGKSFLNAGKSLAESSFRFWTSFPKAGLEAVQKHDEEEDEDEEMKEEWK